MVKASTMLNFLTQTAEGLKQVELSSCKVLK
jgi:hypothetical protein